MIKRIALSLLILCLLIPIAFSEGKTRFSIILIIPKLMPLPDFNLCDSEGECREMTEEEQTEMDEYEALQQNYRKLESRLNKWVIGNIYEQFISRQTPTFLKEGVEYQTYFFPSKRTADKRTQAKIDREIEKFADLGIEAIIALTDNIQQWLTDNGYTQPIVEGII